MLRRSITGGSRSADQFRSPSLGLGEVALAAIEQALEPFEGIVHELLASVPNPAD